MNGILINQGYSASNSEEIINILGYTPVKGIKLGTSDIITEPETDGSIRINKASLGLSRVENKNTFDILSNPRMTGTPYINGVNLDAYISKQITSSQITIYEGNGVDPTRLLFTNAPREGAFISKDSMWKINFLYRTYNSTNNREEINYSDIKSWLQNIDTKGNFTYYLDDQAGTVSNSVTSPLEIFNEVDFFPVLKTAIETLNQNIKENSISFNSNGIIPLYSSSANRGICLFIDSSDGINITKANKNSFQYRAVVVNAFFSIEYLSAETASNFDNTTEGECLKITVDFDPSFIADENNIDSIEIYNDFKIGYDSSFNIPMNQFLQDLSSRVSKIEEYLNI